MPATVHGRTLTEAAARTIAEAVPTNIDTGYIFPAKAAERQLIIDTLTSELLAASAVSAAGGDGKKALSIAAENTTDTVMNARRSAQPSTRETFQSSLLRSVQRVLAAPDPDWYERAASPQPRA
ncbi:hypothetical protein [Curtobacterium sp. MCSS17_016]|uniref:hypothetical protein n=1 Tax=Curtobacterium sp. MCSS17_016 TaxID=2175644 RepID=UPI000DA70F35|nr:hypothetical protein [Curtobacterium sp. MCSS17_016]WIE81340.1 hypothetical protein DEJ19_019085 [Curtobacterium sp. MCSS17_016]